MTRRGGRWELLFVLLLATPMTARAQILRGHVTDAATREPVSGATVTLIRADSQRVAAAVSDDAGVFSISAPPGDYRLSVVRLGYATFTEDPIRLRAGGLSESTILLTTQAIAVDPLGVDVEQQDLQLRRVGFYQRKKQETGTFLDRDFIEKRSSDRISEILGGVRSVAVITDLNGNGTDVRMRTSVTVVNGRPQVCLPLIYVDGLLLSDGKVAGFGRMNLEQIRGHDLAGIELYSGESSVPYQFARGGGACGAVLFWTRGGIQRR